MKVSPHSFSKPVQVIQVYRKQIRFGKEEKGSFDLKQFLSAEKVTSNVGYVEIGELFLPEAAMENQGFSGADLFVLVDNIISEKPAECLTLHSPGANPIEIFKIRGNDPAELHLEWSYFGVGDPTRQSMKLFDLVPGKAYEIRINGKTDFSLTGRRPRHYLEQVFVLEYLGSFDDCRFYSDSADLPAKKLPASRKVIDLRKPLW
ncbi:hypothetical protein [Algoriphagus terrigena]|uniref:hypothetical protein n=1 Tax=Algoriphagus terrigena TaxID=344884 RepID=UPI00041FB351|nr:hypothetical protein [Algoriphagus terrigena]